MDKSGAQRRNNPLRYAAAFAGGALVGAAGIAAYTGRELNSPRPYTWRDEYTFTPYEVQVSHEAVSFVTEDGLTLRGWWFPRPETDRVVVGATGHKGTKPDLLGIGSGLWRAGYNVLLFDYRGCGESDPAPLSVGFYEQRDLRAAIAWSRGRVPGARLGLVGFSMGAALSILAAATDPTIRVVVADSAYATLQGVVANAYGRYRVPSWPFLALSDRYNGWRYGYRYGALRPVAVVGQLAPRPLLIIHGTRDAVTPVAHAHHLYDAAGEPKEVWIAEGAHHCGAYFQDRERYVARVAAFFARGLV
jgi:alpha-beta hydrolase superfamily lysophospholipase